MYLLFDIGGTNTRVGISSESKTIIRSKIVATPTDFDQGIKVLKQIGDELAPGEKILGVSGGIAGPLDFEKTMLVKSPHLPGWIDKPLKKELEKVFTCPVFLENDSHLEGLGEAVFGAGQGYKIVAYLAIGTALGGVRIVDGQIDKNFQGFEPGHQIIVPDGHPCECGGKGHLETYVGGYYLQKTYKQKAEDIADPVIWNEVAKYLGLGLYNISVLWSPEVIILGGSVTQSLPVDKVQTDLGQLLTIFPKIPKIIKGSLGDNAGLFGARILLAPVG